MNTLESLRIDKEQTKIYSHRKLEFLGVFTLFLNNFENGGRGGKTAGTDGRPDIVLTTSAGRFSHRDDSISITVNGVNFSTDNNSEIIIEVEGQVNVDAMER